MTREEVKHCIIWGTMLFLMLAGSYLMAKHEEKEHARIVGDHCYTYQHWIKQ